MKKLLYQIFLPIFALGMMYSCSDSNETPELDPLPTAIEKELESITNKLKTIEGIDAFTEVFKAADIDVKTEELTILATSAAPQKRSLKASNETISKDNIKRHIIAGVHDFFAMATDSLTLESIDGTKLYITKYKDIIYINGIALTKNSNEKISKSVIYILESVIPVESKPLAKYTLNVKVQESLYGEQNITNPYKPVEGATVYFYQLLDSIYTPIDSVKTNKEGLAILHHNVNTDQNDIYYSAWKQNMEYTYHDYLLQGVFTKEEQLQHITYSAFDLYEAAHLGGPIYADLNGDGIVDELDKVYYPRVLNDDNTLEIFMQESYNILEPEQINLAKYSKSLDDVFRQATVNFYNLNAKLKRDSSAYPQLRNLEGYNQNYYVSAYKLIRGFNGVENMEKLSEGNKKIWKEIRAKHVAQMVYTYVSLADTYGTPPLITTLNTDSIRNITNTSSEEILAYLEQKTNTIDGDYKYAAQLALARGYLNMHNYQKADALVKTVIASGKYALDSAGKSWVNSHANGVEVVLGGMSSEGYMLAHAMPYLHPLRYTEAILIAMEASYKLGKTAEALNYLNQLLLRAGEPTEDSPSALQYISYYWNREMYDEGQWFTANGKRWQNIQDLMPLAGSHNNLLRFPMSEINTSNGNLKQNPGYN